MKQGLDSGGPSGGHEQGDALHQVSHSQRPLEGGLGVEIIFLKG